MLVYYFASSMGSISNKIVVHGLKMSPTLLAAVQGFVSLTIDGEPWLLAPGACSGLGGSGCYPLSFRFPRAGVALVVNAPVAAAGAASTASLASGRFVICGHDVRLVEEGQRLVGTLWGLLPVAACVLLGRVMTLISYQTVSVSLAHAAKSLEPALNVGISAVVFREFQPIMVNLALLPIIAGVFLASYGEATYSVSPRAPIRHRCPTPMGTLPQGTLPCFQPSPLSPPRHPPPRPPHPHPPLQHYGFFLAALSAAFRVVEKIFVKRTMAGRALGFLQLHFLVGLITSGGVVFVSGLQMLVASEPFFGEGATSDLR